LWGDLPRGFVEQAHRWLCHPAVIPISPVTDEIREYLLSDVLGSVHVGVGDHPALVADVQPTFDALAVVGRPTGCTRFGRAALVHALDADAALGGFVFQHLEEAVERPSVQVQIAVVAPIGVLADTREVAHGNRPDVAGRTLSYHILRDGVQEVVTPPPALPV